MFESYEILDFLEFQNDGKRHFHINRLDEMPEIPAKIKSPHKHLFYEVFLITQGKAHHNIDYREYHIQADSLFFVSQGQLHLWGKSDRSAMKGYRLMFTEEFFLINNIDKNFLFELVFLDNVYFNPCIELTKKDAEPIQTYFNLLFNEYKRLEPNPKVLQSLLFLALTEIQRIATVKNPKVGTNHEVKVYKSFVELLEVNFKNQLSINDYASKLCLSSKQFTRVIRSFTNQSATQIIRNRVTLEAKRLLTCTDLNIMQIGHELGFEDAAYFSRFFKRETKQSPTGFKGLVVEKYMKTS